MANRGHRMSKWRGPMLKGILHEPNGQSESVKLTRGKKIRRIRRLASIFHAK